MTQQTDPKDPFQPRVFVQTAGAAPEKLDQWQQIGEEELAMVTEMVKRNELSGGTPVVREFEEAWRDYIGARYCVTVINGTAALYSAFFGLGIGPGDEVICPVNTWLCTIAPAYFLGGTPVFCDIDPETLLLDPAAVERRITPNTKCIVAVHLWGNVCDMDALLAIGEKHGIPVLEDCSHAHGAKYKGRMCGSLGCAGVWSLQGSKAVSAGEGGVITSDNVDLFERACLCGQVNRVEGIDLVTERYQHHQPLGLGMKFRAHPLGIGIALVQFRKLDALNARRKAYIEAVEAGLADIPGLEPLRVPEGGERGGFYGFPVRQDPEKMGGVTARQLCEALKATGLSASMQPYVNLHGLPLFQEGFGIFGPGRGALAPEQGFKGYTWGDFPGAEYAGEHTLFLPRLSDPIDGAADYIVDTLKQTIAKLMA